MPSTDRLKRQILELSILTFITVFIWIGYGVYVTLTNPVDTAVSSEELRALPPLLTAEQFDPLRDRLVIDDETLSNFSISAGGLPPVVPTPPPATPSPETSPSASPL